MLQAVDSSCLKWLTFRLEVVNFRVRSFTFGETRCDICDIGLEHLSSACDSLKG